MAEKQLLHSFIGARSHLEVIGRVEIEERKAFDTSAHVEDVAVDGLDAAFLGAGGPVGIEFHAVRRRVRRGGECVQCGACAATWIERGGGCFGKGKSSPQHGPLLNGEGVVSEFQPGDDSHFRGPFNCWRGV